MTERFYTNTDLSLGEVELVGDEVHHLRVVSRHRPDDLVYLFNGDGHEYQARIDSLDRKQATLTVIEVESPQRELPYPLEIACAVPKGDRAELLVEKLTELGVTRFVPLVTARSIVHPRESKLARFRRTAIEAAKQSGRCALLEIAPLTEWNDYLEQSQGVSARILAHTQDIDGLQRGSLGRMMKDRPDLSHGIGLAIGPEGGFTEEEVRVARDLGWSVVDLGPRILRIETAAITLAVCFSQMES